MENILCCTLESVPWLKPVIQDAGATTISADTDRASPVLKEAVLQIGDTTGLSREYPDRHV